MVFAESDLENNSKGCHYYMSVVTIRYKTILTNVTGNYNTIITDLIGTNKGHLVAGCRVEPR